MIINGSAIIRAVESSQSPWKRPSNGGAGAQGAEQSGTRAGEQWALAGDQGSLCDLGPVRLISCLLFINQIIACSLYSLFPSCNIPPALPMLAPTSLSSVFPLELSGNLPTTSYIHICTCTHTHTHTRAHIQIHIYTCAHSHTYMYTHIHTCTHTLIYTHTSHICSLSHAHACHLSHTQRHTYTHACILTHTYMHSHSNRHTCAHT